MELGARVRRGEWISRAFEEGGGGWAWEDEDGTVFVWGLRCAAGDVWSDACAAQRQCDPRRPLRARSPKEMMASETALTKLLGLWRSKGIFNEEDWKDIDHYYRTGMRDPKKGECVNDVMPSVQ